MKPLSFTLGLVAFVAFALSSSHAAERRVVRVGKNPESVTKGFGGHYYVTLINEGNVPGDGTVVKLVGDQPEVFATSLENPKGIVFVGGYLVTADMKTVWKIDAEGRKSVLAAEKDLPFPVSNFLNDVAAAPDGKSVFVSDMGASDKMNGPEGLWPLDSPQAKALPAIGRIYQITLEGKVSIAVDANPDMACPNGVSAPGPDELLVGEFFTGNLISVSQGQRKVLATGYRGADAIERDPQGNLYVSSWTQGKVWKLDPRGQNATVLAEGFQSAADFFLDPEAKQLVLPDMRAGTLTFLPLD
ncbi:MAG: SMP-30/gluconolactonase/LRE family protein [Verrucomicrobiae bacterium]|nr:SMP-30/gluconolactonase/LRE family protein [Verrucomicrobiae bacterium]